MKTNQIPDIYIEQYLLGELPEDLRKKMDKLILTDPVLKERMNRIKQSDSDILTAYPAGIMADSILEKMSNRKKETLPGKNEGTPANYRQRTVSGTSVLNPFGKILQLIQNLSARNYALSIASVMTVIIVMFLIIPVIKGPQYMQGGYDTDVRIKGLESKLLIYRMKGKEIEELKNFSTARAGDILQLGYIATGKYRYGIILSIDGRGTVTLHLPVGTNPDRALVSNKRILLDKSYELDDSPSFERFIMILSTGPLNTADIIKKAKKLAINSDDAVKGLINAGDGSAEFSLIIKKITSGEKLK